MTATTVGAAGYSSQQPRDYAPNLSEITIPTRLWGTSGNTDSVIDASVHPTSAVIIIHTSIPAGFWQVVVSQGSFVVTSSDSETAGHTYQYRVL